MVKSLEDFLVSLVWFVIFCGFALLVSYFIGGGIFMVLTKFGAEPALAKTIWKFTCLAGPFAVFVFYSFFIYRSVRSQTQKEKIKKETDSLSEDVLDFLKKNPLDTGSIDEFQKGRKDFDSWGNGILTGSKEWIVNRLSAKLRELRVSELNITKNKDYEWQASKLENFTVRIQVSLANGTLAGYYIGRLDDNLYGLFGYGFNYDEKEKNEIKATVREDSYSSGSEVQTPSVEKGFKIVRPEYPEWMSAIPLKARKLKIEDDRELLPFGTFKCPVCGQSFGNLPLSSQNVICQFNYGMKGIANGTPQDFANFWWTNVTHCGKKFLVGNKGTA